MTRDEFEYLLTTYEEDIYKLCLRLTGNKDQADDLFQDTWLGALEQAGQISFEKNPQSYLIGKAISLWRGKKRKYARRQRIAPKVDITDQLEEVLFVSDAKAPEEVILDKELSDCLKKEVSMLKERYRVVVELYYSLELKTSEIANILKIPKGTVESRLYKARKILKGRMEEHGYEL